MYDLIKFCLGGMSCKQKAELYEKKLNETNTAEKAQKAHQKQANKVLQTREILYVKNA